MRGIPSAMGDLEGQRHEGKQCFVRGCTRFLLFLDLDSPLPLSFLFSEFSAARDSEILASVNKTKT
jgi:hypothetical protein